MIQEINECHRQLIAAIQSYSACYPMYIGLTADNVSDYELPWPHLFIE